MPSPSLSIKETDFNIGGKYATGVNPQTEEIDLSQRISELGKHLKKEIGVSSFFRCDGIFLDSSVRSCERTIVPQEQRPALAETFLSANQVHLVPAKVSQPFFKSCFLVSLFLTYLILQNTGVILLNTQIIIFVTQIILLHAQASLFLAEGILLVILLCAVILCFQIKITFFPFLFSDLLLKQLLLLNIHINM